MRVSGQEPKALSLGLRVQGLSFWVQRLECGRLRR